MFIVKDLFLMHELKINQCNICICTNVGTPSIYQC